jgi:hypothetical protein
MSEADCQPLVGAKLPDLPVTLSAAGPRAEQAVQCEETKILIQKYGDEGSM